MALLHGVVPCTLLIISVLMLCFYTIYITPNDVTISQYDLSASTYSLVSPLTLFIIRCIFSCIIWSSCIFLLFDPVGLHIVVEIRNKVIPIHLKHGQRFTVYTVWCWTIMGVYYSMAILNSISVVFPDNQLSLPSSLYNVSEKTRYITHILYEISFSMSFLVCFIVTFVLIPGAIKRKFDTVNFFKFLPILFHNANVGMMMIECLLNRIPFVLTHYPFIIIYGLTYVIFSWIWFYFKGVFYYFFLDYERPYAILWYIGLLLCNSMFYLLGLLISIYHLKDEPMYVAIMIIFTVSIMRVFPIGTSYQRTDGAPAKLE